jgi:hypothetical protein
MQFAHERAIQIHARTDGLQLIVAGHVVHQEGEVKCPWKFGDNLVAAAIDGAGVSVFAFEILEEFGFGDFAGQTEARALGKRAVGFQENAAVVIPYGFVASVSIGICGRAGMEGQHKEKRCGGEALVKHGSPRHRILLLIEGDGEEN